MEVGWCSVYSKAGTRFRVIVMVRVMLRVRVNVMLRVRVKVRAFIFPPTS